MTTDKIMQREDEIQSEAQKIVRPEKVKEVQAKEYVPAGPVRLKSVAGKVRLVILESPLAPKNGRTVDQNVEYAQKCVRDSLHKSEGPFASHLLYAQKNVLADDVPEERKLGIEAGLAWGRVADATVIYCDYGVSAGMKTGIARARNEGRHVEFREFAGNECAKTVMDEARILDLLK